MSEQQSKKIAPATWLLVAGCCVFAVLLIAFAYSKHVQNQRSDEASDSFAIAALITDAEADGIESSELLQEYVTTGDETILPEVQTATDTGVRKLTEAVSMAGDDPNRFVERGAGLVQSAGQVIALRQTGDTAGAAAALTELADIFNDFIVDQDAYVTSLEATGESAQNSADNAETAATVIMIAAIVVGAAVVAGALVGIRRRIAQGRVVGTASG